MLVADIDKQGAHESAEKSKQYAKHPEYRAVGVTVDVTDAVGETWGLVGQKFKCNG